LVDLYSFDLASGVYHDLNDGWCGLADGAAREDDGLGAMLFIWLGPLDPNEALVAFRFVGCAPLITIAALNWALKRLLSYGKRGLAENHKDRYD
jgi:hypothetical protein